MSKIILVPSPFDIIQGQIRNNSNSCMIANPNPPMGHVTIDTFQYPVYMDVHMPSGSFRYDPMCDYQAWYGIKNTQYEYITDYDIKARLWQRIDLSNWLEENLNASVLIQNDVGHFKLWFVDGTDHFNFKKWWGEQCLKHRMIVSAPEDYEGTKQQFGAELEKWCKETMTDRFLFSTSNNNIVIHIRSDAEAVQFKLRWNTVDG